MKTKIILSVVMLVVMASTYGQNSTFEFTFSAVDNASYVLLDSVKVMNRTQGGSTMLYWPDTTMTLEINPGDTLLYIGYSTRYPVGIKEENQKPGNFQLFQNFPNPVIDNTVVSLYIPERGSVNLMVVDMPGREVIDHSWLLEKGYHSFRFNPGHGNLFFLTASWNGINRSIKILSTANKSGNSGSLEYIGRENKESHLKESAFRAGIVEESGLLDDPDANKNYTFQFATNIPCPGTPTVTYEGQVYNTIQIFSQCWLKENLNVGTMIPGTQGMSNNSVIEKYCYNNEVDSCTKYGGLYQWDEMMQYTTQQGSQGICPPDWHLPADEEWIVLEGAVDSQFGIGNPYWDNQGLRGTDAGKNLKTTSGWENNGNGTDLFGFSAMAASYRILSGGFDVIGAEGVWWMSTQSVTDYAWYHIILYFSPKTGRYADSYSYKEYGFSVRCLRDY